jgi:protein O-mannosyl-transferase
LPVLGLVGFDFQRYSTVADRYMYLPMLGVALAAAIWPRAVVLLIAIALAVQSESQMRYWRDTPALVDHTLALDPLSTIGNKILAAEYARKGQWPEAAGAYRTALIRNPDDGDLHFNLANALRGQGDFESAIEEYREAIGLLGPEYRLRAMNNLGIAYYLAGRPDLAEAEFMAIIQIDPGNAEARENMSKVVGGVPSR